MGVLLLGVPSLLLLLPLLLQSVSGADPKCSTGILAAGVCCLKSCGTCGGPNCGTHPGGSAGCCTGTIKTHADSCTNYDPPCVYHATPPPTVCGDFPAPLRGDRPNVLLIGDSISMPVPFTPGGYGVNVKELLTAKGMNVWHNGGWESGGQASNTVKGLLCTNTSTPGNWLNVTGTYDAIHFNFGLHGARLGTIQSLLSLWLHRLCPCIALKCGGPRSDLVDAGPGEGKEHVELLRYGSNLQEIYQRLAPRCGSMLMCTAMFPPPPPPPPPMLPPDKINGMSLLVKKNLCALDTHS